MPSQSRTAYIRLLRYLPSQCVSAGFTVCLILSLCTPKNDLILSSRYPPVRLQALLWSPLILLFLWQSKSSSKLPNCVHYPSLHYAHVSSVLGSSELHTVLRMLLSSLRRENEASRIFWLHSWMLLAFFAARTADSRSPYLPVGTHSSFPANLHPHQLTLTCLVAQGYFLSDAGLLLAAELGASL